MQSPSVSSPGQDASAQPGHIGAIVAASYGEVGHADPESPFSAMETLARWRIVGEPAPVKAKPTTIDLDRDDDYLVDPISIGDLIDGRYGDRQFQVREDMSAALFVCGSRTVRAGPDGAEVTMPVYEYCDKDVRVRCAANSQGIALDPLLAPRIVRTGSFAHDESAASHI